MARKWQWLPVAVLLACGPRPPAAVTTVAPRVNGAMSVACTTVAGPLASARVAARAFRSGAAAGSPMLFVYADRPESLRYEACVPVANGTTRQLAPFTLLSLTVDGATPETVMPILLDWLAAHPGYRISGPVVEVYQPAGRTEVGIVVAPSGSP